MRGAAKVARLAIGLTRKVFARSTKRFAEVNGQLAVLVHLDGALLGVLIPSIAGGRIREFDWVLNPDKLHRVKATWH